MRNEPLIAFSLHQRPLQEKRSIYYLFTKEYGMMHGVFKKGIPQFVPLTLFATGKKSLKTLQQVTATSNIPSLKGTNQYAALYLNEITLKLLPIEDTMPKLYEQYEQTILALLTSLTPTELKLLLRTYELVLFNELGHSVDLYQDYNQQPIQADNNYYFGADRGWYLADDGIDDPNELTNKTVTPKNVANKETTNNRFTLLDNRLLGKDIIAMREGINEKNLVTWSFIHRELIDYFFEYQPLQSRLLWHQYMRYQ